MNIKKTTSPRQGDLAITDNKNTTTYYTGTYTDISAKYWEAMKDNTIMFVEIV